MKQGRSLTELAQEIERQRNAKRDFVVPTELLRMVPGNPTLSGDQTPPVALEFRTNGHSEAFPVRDFAHGQIAQRLGIPKAYYDRMRAEAPELLATNANHWFQANAEKRMVRTLDGAARAFLSDRYRPLDNYDLMQAALPVLMETEGMRIDTCQVTENRLTLKAIFPKIEGEIGKGDIVQAGLVITNSEIGASSVRVEPLIFRLVCLNGLISNTALRKYHVGRSDSSIETAYEVFSNRTKELTDAAFWAQVKDVVRSAVTRDLFEGQLERLRAAADRKIVSASITEVIEVTRKTLALSECESQGVLQHLIKGGDLSQWGLANAVTRTAQDAEDYDRSTELERIGGQVIELAPADWRRIAEAA